MSSAPLSFVPTASPEDQARAQLYGLVASLYYGAPDAQLLSALVHAEGFSGAGGTGVTLVVEEVWRVFDSRGPHRPHGRGDRLAELHADGCRLADI